MGLGLISSCLTRCRRPPAAALCGLPQLLASGTCHHQTWRVPVVLQQPHQALSDSFTCSEARGARTFFNRATAAASKKYSERRLIGYSPEQLYDVVAGVEEYHRFVPWCRRSSVLTRSPDGNYLEAELEVGFQMLNERYISKVTLQPTSRVHSTSSQSHLFQHLDSTWSLRPGPLPNTTWLSFNVDFAFQSVLYSHITDLFFSEVVQRMMSAFEGRCRQLYGPGSLTAAGRQQQQQAGQPQQQVQQQVAGQHAHRQLQQQQLQRQQQQQQQVLTSVEGQQQPEQQQGLPLPPPAAGSQPS